MTIPTDPLLAPYNPDDPKDPINLANVYVGTDFKGDGLLVLDGEFSVEDLRRLILWMEQP